MGDVIFVNFRDKSQPSRRQEHNKQLLDKIQHEENLKVRLNNIQGSLNRINRLIVELKKVDNKDLTSEELDKILDEVHIRG